MIITNDQMADATTTDTSNMRISGNATVVIVGNVTVLTSTVEDDATLIATNTGSGNLCITDMHLSGRAQAFIGNPDAGSVEEALRKRTERIAARNVK